nr:MMPL family transporter [Nitrosomonas sp.]
QEAKKIAARLEKLPEVDKVVSIFDLVPDQQENKLLLIDDMALTLGPIVFLDKSENTGDHGIDKQLAALELLNKLLAELIAEQPGQPAATSARALHTSLTNYLAHLDSESSKGKLQSLNAASHDLLGLLPDALNRLQVAFEATPFTQQELPSSLSGHWHSQNGVYRIAVYPTENIGDNDALRRFVRAVQQTAPQATGVPIISLEAGEAVVNAFIHAFSLALVGVVLALLLLLRNFVDTLLVLMPLLLAALFTGAATVLLGIPFNFANIIALPLLLGIGIDCSIHIVHRFRNGATLSEDLLRTSTVRAIFYSALTTVAGFGSLAFSTHQGTASMGLLLAVGVVLTLICVLVILPALLSSLNLNRRTI